MRPNNTDGMAISVDIDQTAPLGAVRSWSALFAQTYLSRNLEILHYAQSDLCYWFLPTASQSSYSTATVIAFGSLKAGTIPELVALIFTESLATIWNTKKNK